MSELTIYGIPSCDSCRSARKWLADNNREYRFHDLRQHGVDIQMLERWAQSLNWQTILNTRSATWRRIPEIDRADITMSRAFALILDHPTLIKRPILECGEHVTAGFSAGDYESLFAKID